jgi:hypothetical protein
MPALRAAPSSMKIEWESGRVEEWKSDLIPPFFYHFLFTGDFHL